MFDTGAKHDEHRVPVGGRRVRVAVRIHQQSGLEVDLLSSGGRRFPPRAVTFNAAGDGSPGCASAITLFYTNALVRIDAWGGWREVAIGGGAVRESAKSSIRRCTRSRVVRPADAQSIDGHERIALCPVVGRDQGISRRRWQVDRNGSGQQWQVALIRLRNTNVSR
jgi:hypothetical protein